MAIPWSPPTGPRNADAAVHERRRRLQALEDERQDRWIRSGANPRLFELVWDTPAALAPYLHDQASEVDWLDDGVVEGDLDWIPLASTYTGEDAWLATADGRVHRYDCGTIEAVDEVWAWAALIGCAFTMALEECLDDPEALEAIVAPVRAELAGSGCPRLVLWLDAVVHLAVTDGALFWSGAEVDAAMDALG